MWFKFAAIVALIFHRADALKAVDYWLRGSGLRMQAARPLPINKEWKTEPGQHGSVLLANVPTPTEKSPKSLSPGAPEDYVALRHKAFGVAADHPANREYK